MRWPRLQFHLSTAIVMMVVASVLLGLNLQKKRYFYFETYKTFVHVRRKEMKGIFTTDGLDVGPHGNVRIEERIRSNRIAAWRYGWPLITVDKDADWHDRYYYDSIALNVAIGIAILAAVWGVCEWVIRRCASGRRMEARSRVLLLWHPAERMNE